MIDNEERIQLLDFEKTSMSPGWGHYIQLCNVQREMILRQGKNAIEAGETNKAAYWMAILDGFDKCIGLADGLKRRYKDIQEEALAEAKEKQENAHDE